jgi:hypothetical protein
MNVRLFLSVFLLLGSLSIMAQNTPKGKLIVVEEVSIIKLRKLYAEKAAEQDLLGYRVQIFNGGLKACEKQRAAFIGQYPELKVQTVYESPEYKVQVGNFTSKLDAERFLNLMSDDFTGFVVRTTIQP